MYTILASTILVSATFLSGCASMQKAPIKPMDHVELARFMGSWYVIGSIPTFLEKNSYNAVESYQQNPNGTIATTFTFHKGSFDGPLKTMKPTGFIRDPSNAVWGMRLVWPVKSEYLIAYLDADYSETIIARTARDYVWIMAKKPHISDVDYQRLLNEVSSMGYDISKVRATPQRWP